MNHKTVSALSWSDKDDLELLVKESPSARVRQRAEAILLSAKGYSIKQISEIKGKCVITVSRWIDQWEERGVDGILEGEGRGRKGILTEGERQEIGKWLAEESPPRSAAELCARIAKAFAKKISKDTARRLLKAAGKVWKRVRCGLAGERDEDSFRLCEQELAEHLQASGRGQANLLYLDESGFNGVPYIPYAWQDKGATLELPCPKGKRINVLGILSVTEAKLETHIPEGRMTSEFVLNVLDGLSENAKGNAIPTVLVLDNASIHTAKIIQDKRQEWEDKNLFLYFLPTYSPELNLIEILWRKIKYDWLPFDAHESYDKLRSCLENIFNEFGSAYNIIWT
jgi:transposase